MLYFSVRSEIIPTKFGHHMAFLNNMTPIYLGWPLHDLWPRQSIILQSSVLLTKFGCLKIFLSNLTPDWPRLTPVWPLTPAVHYTSIRGHSYQLWWPKGILKQIDLWTFDPGRVRFGNMFSHLVGPSPTMPTPMPSFISLPQRMTKRIAVHTYFHLHTHTCSIILVVQILWN